MVEFAQHLANGISSGALYGLLAVGLTLVFGVARVGNFAHGDFLMVAAYSLYLIFVVNSLNFVVAGTAAVLVAILLALVVERAVYRPLYETRGHGIFIAALGVSTILQSGALIVFGATPRSIGTGLGFGRLEVFGVALTYQRVFAILGAIGAFVLLDLFLRYSLWGKAIRGVAQNRATAQAVGIVPQQIWILTMVLSALLAGWGAVLMTPIVTIFPAMGHLLVLKAFAVVIVGGLGHVYGAILAAFILGITESLTAGYLAADYRDAIAFVVLILVVLVRPQGLFGRVSLS